MAIDTDIFFNKDDVNKNLYRKKTYYTLIIEQEVLANNKDEADKKFTECERSLDKILHEESKHFASKRTRSGSNT